jgi:molybdate transport system ATP-binding protein
MMLDVDIRLERDDHPLAFKFRTDGGVTGVFGRSGAGKTSLLHLVAGLLTPSAGTIRLGDDTLFDAGDRVDVPVHRRGVVMAFQDDRLLPHLSVDGNLAFAERLGARRTRPVARDDVVRALGLGELLKRRTHRLSGGERQRVALGRAVLAAPRLLLLDEPLSSLDRAARREILDLIRHVRDAFEVPMLYVSHDLTELLRLTDRLLVVEGGRSVGHGSLRALAGETDAWSALHDLGPANVVPLRVIDHDAEAALTRLGPASDGARAAADGPIVVAPISPLAPGTVATVAIRPSDIALARAHVDGISIQNQLPGTVEEVTPQRDRAVAAIDVGGTTLLVEVSHRTVRQMDLAPGAHVYCLIKSNAVTYVG